MQMRTSDGDRDKVAEVLREAAAEGRITLDELDERLERTYRAQTYADLTPITADLPTAGAAQSTHVPSPVGGAVAGAGQVEPAPPLVIRSTAGSVVRRGNWQAPQRIEVSNPSGETRLDFHEATLLSDVIDIVVNSPLASTRIVLPDNATAAISVDTSWLGGLDSAVPEIPAPPAPHFRISGNIKAGMLKVRYPRPRDELANWLNWENWT